MSGNEKRQQEYEDLLRMREELQTLADLKAKKERADARIKEEERKFQQKSESALRPIRRETETQEENELLHEEEQKEKARLTQDFRNSIAAVLAESEKLGAQMKTCSDRLLAIPGLVQQDKVPLVVYALIQYFERGLVDSINEGIELFEKTMAQKWILD